MRGLKSLPTDVRWAQPLCRLLSQAWLPDWPASGTAWTTLAPQRTASLVLRPLPSVKRHLPLCWHVVPKQCAFPGGCVHWQQNRAAEIGDWIAFLVSQVIEG